MPSFAKRAREENPGEVVEVLESARANLQASNKRLRLAADLTREESRDMSELVSDNLAPSTQYHRQPESYLTQYERDRDLVEDVNSDEDEENIEKVTQAIDRHHAGQPMDNRAAENGVLESLTCTNFMCHAKLSVALGPLINFIIGHNGSGKSAVLTAITLCLGGKATSTNRGQSLKSFVKEGQESATLSVKIRNEGDYAYKRDLYGRSIVVERHFSIHGTSGFKIKSADGRIISTKRSELDDISDFFALQLENPVNVLTQDMARQFLNSSSAADKYRFFVRGVLLEQLDRDYMLVAESLDGADARMEDVTADCEVLKKKFDAAMEKKKLTDRHDTMREKHEMYINMMGWAQVEEQERALEDCKEDIGKADEKIQDYQSQLERRSASYDQICQKYTEGEEHKTQLEESLQPFVEEEQEADAEYETIQNQQSTALSEQRQIKTYLKTTEKNVQQRQKDIDEENSRLERISGGAEKDKRAEIASAEEKVQELLSIEQQYRDSDPQLQRDVQEAESQVKDVVDHYRSRNNELHSAQAQLRGLRDNAGRQNAGFHPKLDNLLSAIQRDSRFTQKPVGPMGRHIRLLKPEWSSILEKTFGGNLSGFVVTNKRDQELLSENMRRIGYPLSTPVLIGNPTLMNTSGKEPDPLLETVLRVIEIDNDLVRNQLLIHHHIEQVVLMKTQRDAIEFMFEFESRGESKPQNVNSCICPHGQMAGHGLRMAWTRGNSQRQDPVPKYEGSPRMKTDIEAQINIQNQVVQRLRQDVQMAEQQKRESENRATASKQAVNRMRNTLKSTKEQVQRAQDDVEKLTHELQELGPRDSKLDELKDQLASCQEELEHYQSQMSAMEDHRNELSDKSRQAENILQEKKQQKASKEREIKTAENSLETLGKKKRESLLKKNEAHEKVKYAEQEKVAAQERVAEQAETVKEFERQAGEGGKMRIRVDEGETGDSLDRKINKLQKEIERFDRSVGGDKETIYRRAHEAKKAHVAAEKRFKELKELSDALALSLQERQNRWHFFRSSISVRARGLFMRLLAERGFRGKMLIDHQTKQLELQVEPDSALQHASSRSGDVGRKTKTLSGGEKSFSTICMLLALWESMGSPIRCLDEFDVFMDSVNRHKSMEMLISAARRSVGRQYIFITPQAMNNADLGPDVRIIRLSDPERGQQTLNLPGA